MKRIVIVAIMMIAAAGVKAQNCDIIMLPFFNGNRIAMDNYPQEKFDYRCRYARVAFYEADAVPEGAVLRSITDVQDKATGEYLTADFVVDLDVLSYYAYNFNELQVSYPSCDVILCFATPSSAHPYLVLRSINDTYARAAFPEQFEQE